MAERTGHRHRFVIGLVVCLILPAASWIFADGALAYTMYSRIVLYRLELRAYDAQGHVQTILPHRLADRIDRHAATLVTGAEHWQRAPRATGLGAHLQDLLHVTCSVEPKAERVEVTLHEQRDDDEQETLRTASARCKP